MKTEAPITGNTPSRRCFRCGSPEVIASSAKLWPKDWHCGQCGWQPNTYLDFVQLAPELDETNEGFDLRSYQSLRLKEEGHFWFATRNELIGWLVRRFAGEAKRVLELGCGTGFTLYALRDSLPAAQFTGSELHSRGLLHARERHGQEVELLQMDARHCGLIDAIDLVAAFDVLEHIDEDEEVLEEIYRTLKPGGILIATVPQHPWLWSAVDEASHHCRRYRIGELRAKARKAGFNVLYQTSFSTLAFPLMAADRLLGGVFRKKAADKAISAEAPMSPGLNGALTAIFRVEHWLRRNRLPLPFGGSQVLVAEKPKQIS